MLFRLMLASVISLAFGVGSASATLRISEDRGGQIGQYVENFLTLRTSGEKVVIDGPCLSACTMVLGFVPPDRICVTPQARLGFHAAWRPDAEGHPVRSDMGTRFLWEVYPRKVRHWITRRGGLQRTMIFLQGDELAAMYRPCLQQSTSR